MTPIPSSKPIALIWKHIEEAKTFATAAGVPLTPQNIIQVSESLLQATH